MTDASVTTHDTRTTARRSPRALWPAALLIVAATVVNLGLYALGRAIDAAMVLDPAGGLDPNHALHPWDVAWKTAGMLMLGTIVAMLVAPRSRRWAIALVWLAGAFGVASVIGPVVGAHDAATAWVLFGMHATGTIAGVLIALLVLRRSAPPAPRTR